MRKIITILLFCIITFFGVGWSCKHKETETAEQKLRKALPIEIPSPLPVIYQFETPKTAYVGTNIQLAPFEKESVTADVDEGLNRLFASTVNLGYTQWSTYYPYTIIYAAPTSYSEEGNCPTLNLKDGTKIAGTVISIGNPANSLEPPFILVAMDSNPASHFCREFAIKKIQYEGEHIIAWYNDRAFFYAHTGTNDIHPFYTQPLKKADSPEDIKVDAVLNSMALHHGTNMADLDEKTQKLLKEVMLTIRKN